MLGAAEKTADVLAVESDDGRPARDPEGDDRPRVVQDDDEDRKREEYQRFVEDLEHIGYTLRPPTGALGRYTLATRRAVDRFQRHFFAGSRSSIRSGVTLGVADANTRAWIRAVRVNIP